MMHFRKIVFDLIKEGKSDEEIMRLTRLTLPRVKNYREAYNKLDDETKREQYIKGKFNLIGD